MNHQFNMQIATLYGVDIAIFLENIAFWTYRNIANQKNFKADRYWVYNTQEAWTKLFPYWTRQNIRTIIKKCEAYDLIVKDNFNQRSGDMTTWLSMTNKAAALYPSIKAELDKIPNENNEQEELSTPLVDSNQALVSSNQALVGINQALPDNKLTDNKLHIKSFCRTDQKEANSKKHDWAEMKTEAAAIAKSEQHKKALAEAPPLVDNLADKMLVNRKDELYSAKKEWGPGHPSWESLHNRKAQ